MKRLMFIGWLFCLSVQAMAVDMSGMDMSGIDPTGTNLPEMTAWSRATPPGATSGALYGEIRNNTLETFALQSVDFPGAGHVMIHETMEVDGMARMRHAMIRLEPGETVTLAPGGIHVMIMGLTAPLVKGCRYPFTVTWSNGESAEYTTATGDYGQQQPVTEDSRPCP